MNASSVKAFLHTPKGKLIAALSVLILTWIILLINFAGGIAVSLPNDEKKAKVKQEIRKLRAELQIKEASLRKNEQRKKEWKTLAERCWQPDRDGDPELILRQNIEAIAKKSELKLNTLGTVRTSRINQDFAFAELDISANAPLETIVKFIAMIQQQKPEIGWKRLTIYSIIRRNRQNNNQSKTITNGSTDDSLIFSGNLRVMVYDGTATNKVKTTKDSNNNQERMPRGPFGGPGGMPPGPPPGGGMPR